MTLKEGGIFVDYNCKLPLVNDNGYFEIRLESIGGLGANLCGKLLGELGAVQLGLNSANFASYGSEKRGSPVKSFVRWCEDGKDLRVNSPIESPHILGIFHENMAGKKGVLAGVTEKTKIVVNTDETPDTIRERFQIYAGEIHCIDALKIAMESKTRINMVMLGAILKASAFVPMEAAVELVKESLGKKYPEVLQKNIEGIERGYKESVVKAFQDDGKYQPVQYAEVQNNWGYENAPIGGCNPHFGSTISNDLSASREGRIPLFIKEKCINCGLCDSTCPDMVFQFKMTDGKIENYGLDYHHCKGCLRCVAVCPTKALVAGKERESEKKYFVRNKDLIVDKMEYEKVGANSWVTSESYMDDERV